jgi:hypothetical protein
LKSFTQQKHQAFHSLKAFKGLKALKLLRSVDLLTISNQGKESETLDVLVGLSAFLGVKFTRTKQTAGY